jgi:hypothetical protein
VVEFGLAGLQHLTVSRGLRVSARPGRRVEGAVPEIAPTPGAAGPDGVRSARVPTERNGG